ncbi:unnamed protein product [Clonostachys solani]|uniref:Uncharacterized protein n=1 Tax=Clonostachys solani TaxID=160281 RepID=A0A9N9ZKL3_9HYPO|nr:unnamed protein product [Clonostachys solani]
MARANITGGQPSLDETFSKLARASIYDWAETDRHLDYLRTYCILIDYDAAKCHGKQAWANISISKALLQLYRAQSLPPLDEIGVLERIEFYLQIKEATHSLGHGALESCVLSQTVAWASHNSDYTQVGSEQRLLELLRFFVRIHNYNNKDNSETHVLQPWKSGSDFRTLHTEMEEYTLHRQPKHQQLGKVVGSLKFAFTLLAAVRRFYAPAASWAKEAQASPNASVGRSVLDLGERQNDESQQPAWVQNYAGHLSEDIEAEEIRLLRGESPSNAISLIGSSGETAVGQDGSVDTAHEHAKALEKMHEASGINSFGEFPVIGQGWVEAGGPVESWSSGVAIGADAGTLAPAQPAFAEFLAMGGVDFDLDAVLGSDPIFGDFWPDIMPSSPSFLFPVGDKTGPQ